MQSAVFAAFGHYFFGWVGFLIGLFLILLILIQRGRGGGLAGAFGGMGGQSAFGTKAGDTFTRVTVVVAAIWILTCMASIKLVNKSVSADESKQDKPSIESSDGAGAPKDDVKKDAATTDAAPKQDDAAKPETTTKDAKQPVGPSPD